MNTTRILCLSLTLAWASIVTSASAQSTPETVVYSIEQKVARTPIGVGTLIVQNAIRPAGRGWDYARGASIQLINVRTSATVAWGVIDNVGNWSGNVPAGQSYLVKITGDGGRLNYTTYVGYPNVGGMRVLRNPRLRY